MKKVLSLVRAPLLAATFLWLLRKEARSPLRPARQPKATRLARNLALAASGAVALAIVERPLVGPLARFVERKRWGLARLPPALAVPLAIVALDYTLYLWHVLTHRVPALWRFHMVHHADLDLDASTGLRFHFGELVISVAFRAAQVGLLGVAPFPLRLWQSLLLFSVLFHHSNVRLDPRFERRLGWLLVTPRLHGIHHTAAPGDTDSNWSSGLTLWDRVHGTLRTVRSAEPIGVPGHPEDLPLRVALALPFRPQENHRARFGTRGKKGAAAIR